MNSPAGTRTIGAPSLPVISGAGWTELAGLDAVPPLAGCGDFAGDLVSPSGTRGFAGAGADCGFAGIVSFLTFSAGDTGSGALLGDFVSLSCVRGLEGAGAGEGAGTWEEGTVGAVVGAISVFGTAGSVASAFVETTELAQTNAKTATGPIHPMSDHNS